MTKGKTTTDITNRRKERLKSLMRVNCKQHNTSQTVMISEPRNSLPSSVATTFLEAEECEGEEFDLLEERRDSVGGSVEEVS